MKVLYIGDIMGQPGIETVAGILPEIKEKNDINLVVAQSENVTDGKGMLPEDMDRLKQIGVDFFTGGNHTPARAELLPLLEDESSPVIGPANMTDCHGPGWKYFDTPKGKVLIVSILGSTVGKVLESENPLHTIDKILEENRDIERAATIVNFHGDYSSEKVIFGNYLDGRVTAVIGDHWHIPTADARVLPAGTAHITDVGMCGTLNSSLGVKFDSVIPRWRDNIQTINELETEGPRQFNAVLIEIDEDTNRAKSIFQIRNTTG